MPLLSKPSYRIIDWFQDSQLQDGNDIDLILRRLTQALYQTRYEQYFETLKFK